MKHRSYPILNVVAKALSDHPDLRVRIEGHTDDRGKADWNVTLSGLRAAAVRRYLIEKGGIAADRLDSEGFGFNRPLVEGKTEAARAKNRRVEFVIINAETAPPTTAPAAPATPAPAPTHP